MRQTRLDGRSSRRQTSLAHKRRRRKAGSGSEEQSALEQAAQMSGARRPGDVANKRQKCNLWIQQNKALSKLREGSIQSTGREDVLRMLQIVYDQNPSLEALATMQSMSDDTLFALALDIQRKGAMDGLLAVQPEEEDEDESDDDNLTSQGFTKSRSGRGRGKGSQNKRGTWCYSRRRSRRRRLLSSTTRRTTPVGRLSRFSSRTRTTSQGLSVKL